MPRRQLEAQLKHMPKFKLQKKKEEDDEEDEKKKFEEGDIEQIHTLKAQKAAPFLHRFFGAGLTKGLQIKTHHHKKRGKFINRPNDSRTAERNKNPFASYWWNTYTNFDEMRGHHEGAPWDYSADLDHLDMYPYQLKQEGLLIWEDNEDVVKEFEDYNYLKDKYNWGGITILQSTFN